MSELEKKTKTGNFIKDLVLRYDSANKHLWVRLEDAQELEQRVKSLETDRDRLLESLEICTKNLNYYAKETFELKQKLQQTVQKIQKCRDSQCAIAASKITACHNERCTRGTVRKTDCRKKK